MAETEKQESPTVLRMLAYEETGVGKIISVSKRKYIWTFDLDSDLHSVTFLLSALSKKWVVIFDTDEKKSGMLTLIRNLEISFHAASHYFAIVQNFLSFEMYIDGCLFKPNSTILLDKRLPPPSEEDENGVRGRVKCHTDASTLGKEDRKFSMMDRFRKSISEKAMELGQSVKDNTKKLLHLGKKEDKNSDTVQEEVKEDTDHEEDPVFGDRRASSAPPMGEHHVPNCQPTPGDCDQWLHDIFSESTIAEIEVSQKLDIPRAIVYEGDLEEYAVVDFNGRTKGIDNIILNCYAYS
jgi:hypothetical protein